MKLKTTKIKTERLVLRKMHFYDVPYARKWFCSSGVTRFSQGAEVPSLYSLLHFYARSAYNCNFKSEGYALWAITQKGKMIGFIRVFPVKTRIDRYFLLYYMLDPRFQGNGYMTEALNAVSQYSFDSGVNLLSADCDVDNTSSIELLKRCGFTQYNITPEWFHYRDGRTGDAVTYIKKNNKKAV